MTTKIRPIEVNYKVQGRKLIPDTPEATHYFIVGHRSTQTLKRASKYLVLFHQEGKMYFSSLYPLEGRTDQYEAEHDGVLYRIELGTTRAIIKKVGYV